MDKNSAITVKRGWRKKLPTLLFCTVFSFVFILFITYKSPVSATTVLTATAEDAYYGTGVTISVNGKLSVLGIDFPLANSEITVFQVVNGTEVELEGVSDTTDSAGDATIVLGGTLGDLTVGVKTFRLKSSVGGYETDVAVNILPYDADNKVGFLSGGAEHDNKIWYKAGEDVVINAPSGFSLSNSFALVSNEWKDSISVPAFGTEGEVAEYTYYLKNNESGAISTAKTAKFYTDLMAPTGKITVNDIDFTFLSTTVNLGFFYNEAPTVEIEGADGKGSGIASIEFFVDDEAKSKSAMPSVEDMRWEMYRAFGVDFEQRTVSVVYARITDRVGNVAYLSTDAVVLYDNSASTAKDVEFEKTDSADLRLSLNSSGNTMDEVSVNGSSVSVEDFTAKTSGNTTTLTLTAEYLNTLKQGLYEVVVSYNPLGEEFFEMDGYENNLPKKTEFELSILGAEPKASWKPTDQTSTFTDEPITYTGEGNIDKGAATGSVSYRYYTTKNGGKPLSVAPSKVGKYYVEAVIAADDNYAEYALSPRAELSIVDESSNSSGSNSGTGTGGSGTSGSGSGSTGSSGSNDSGGSGSGSGGDTGELNGGSGDNSSGGLSESEGLFFLFSTDDLTGDVIPPSDEGPSAEDKYTAFVGKEISRDGITWLNVGDLATVGVDNTNGDIPDGAQFWVKVVDGAGLTADWNDYYSEIDPEYRDGIDTGSAIIMHMGILLQDGRAYNEMERLSVFVQNDGASDTESLNALYINSGQEEPLSLISAEDSLAGQGAYGIELTKFTPIIIYEQKGETVISEVAQNIGGLINTANQAISGELSGSLKVFSYVVQRVFLALLCITIAFGLIFGLSRVVKKSS